MISHTTDRFRKALKELPDHIQHQAKVAFELWKKNPYHPSLRFKQIHSSKPIYSVRIGRGYRSIGVQEDEVMIWFWIGSHADYDKLITQI